MTEVKAETIRLIHTGARDLQIANLLNEKYEVFQIGKTISSANHPMSRRD